MSALGLKRDGHDLLRLVQRRIAENKGRAWLSRRTVQDHGFDSLDDVELWANENGLVVQPPLTPEGGYELTPRD